MLIGIASYIKRHHLALFALFFALGGTAFAAGNALLPGNSVGTKQVINGSLQANDLSKTARTALKGNRGPTGPAGPAGARALRARRERRERRERKVSRECRVSRRPSSLSHWMPTARSRRTAVRRWRLEQAPASTAFPSTPTSRTASTSGLRDRTLVVFRGTTTTSIRAAPARPRSTSRSSMELTPSSICLSISRSSVDHSRNSNH
jgi:hypothetical protein